MLTVMVMLTLPPFAYLLANESAADICIYFELSSSSNLDTPGS